MKLTCDSGLGSAICVKIRRSRGCQEQILPWDIEIVINEYFDEQEEEPEVLVVDCCYSNLLDLLRVKTRVSSYNLYGTPWKRENKGFLDFFSKKRNPVKKIIIQCPWDQGPGLWCPGSWYQGSHLRERGGRWGGGRVCHAIGRSPNVDFIVSY